MGIVFKNHTMNFPDDERTLNIAVYRDDMIKHIKRGDEIKSSLSAGNVWKFDDSIRFNEITWWNGKKVFDYSYLTQSPVISDPVLNSEGTFFRSDLIYGDKKFAQFIVPAYYFRNKFTSSIYNKSKMYYFYHVLSQCKYHLVEVLNIKRLTDKVLIHGKETESNVFEPHVGFNAYVDFVLSLGDIDEAIGSAPVEIKSRVYLKSIQGTENDEDIVDLARLTLNSYVNDVCKYLTDVYGESFYIV
jgi:hypothetical protein